MAPYTASPAVPRIKKVRANFCPPDVLDPEFLEEFMPCKDKIKHAND
jgi:hypothetical protein